MTRIPAVGERVYVWRSVVNSGRVERHRASGTVEKKGFFSWLSEGIRVLMDDTGEVEAFGHWDLDSILPTPRRAEP
jgi:hypothetical protein